MAWAKDGTDTLSSTADSQSVTISEKNFHVALSHVLPSGAINGHMIRLNGDNSANYAYRRSIDGATDTTGTSDDKWQAFSTGDWDRFSVTYLSDISGEEKLAISFYIGRNTAGAATAPTRAEIVGKYDQTGSRVTTFGIVQTATSADFAANTNTSVLGTDLTPAAGKTIETGSIYIDTDTNQRYFWNGSSWSLQA